MPTRTAVRNWWEPNACGRSPFRNARPSWVTVCRPSAPEWIFELFEVTTWHRVTLHAVARRPLVLREIVRAKQTVQQREMHREIHVDCLIFQPVMPMMKAGRYKEVFDERKTAPEVGMDQGRIKVDRKDVAVHRHTA